MEIHAPSHPLKTLREFLSHIFVVTVGILIALWFDGLKESFHDRRLVQEARENFRLDIQENRAHLKPEIQSLDAALSAVDSLLGAEITSAAPGAKVKVAPGFYFFRSTSWDTALSTGALAHMKPAEVVRYAEMHEAVKTYSELERVALNIFVEYSALNARPQTSAEAQSAIRDRLALLQQHLGILRHLADELAESIDKADKATHVDGSRL